MTNKLQQYFPMIRTEEEVLSEINSRSHLEQMYEEWEKEEQKEFLDFVTGAKGVKMMYDSVSYTHLDVYKRQSLCLQRGTGSAGWSGVVTDRL